MPTGVKVGIAVVVLAVLGGVGWFVVAGRSSTGTGAASPDEAVEQLATALADDDMIGVMEALDPDEVGPLAELADVVLRRAGELELVTVTERGLADLKIGVEGLELSVEELHPDVARVTIDGGEISTDFTSPTLDLVMANDGEVVTYEAEELSARADLDDVYHDIEDGPSETFVMAVRRDGGWYVSPLYTAAEVIRQSTDLDEPDFDASRNQTEGADSPVAAVEAFAAALADLDPEAGVRALPPGEWGFARDYLDALMEEIDEDELEDTRRDLDLALDDLELVEGEDLGGGRRTVEVRSLGLEWTDEYDGETRMSVEGRCAEVTTEDDSDDESGQDCLEDWLADGGYDPSLAALLPEQPYVVTVQDDGGWYVSPMETLAAYLHDAVERMDGDDLDALGLVEPRALEVGEVTEGELATPFRRAAYSFELEDGEAYLLSIETDDASMDLTVHPRGGSTYGMGAAWVPSDRDLPFVAMEATGEQYLAVVEADTWELDEDDWDRAVPFTVEIRPLEVEGELTLDDAIEVDLDEGQRVAYSFESDGDVSFVPELEGDAKVSFSCLCGSDPWVELGVESDLYTEGTYVILLEATSAGTVRFVMESPSDTFEPVGDVPPEDELLLDPPESLDGLPELVVGTPATVEVAEDEIADLVVTGADGYLTVTATATDGAFDPVMVVFDENLDLVVQSSGNPDLLQAEVTFYAEAGASYVVSVAGYSGSAGAGEVEVVEG